MIYFHILIDPIICCFNNTLVVLNFRLVAKLRDRQLLLTLSLFCNKNSVVLHIIFIYDKYEKNIQVKAYVGTLYFQG